MRVACALATLASPFLFVASSGVALGAGCGSSSATPDAAPPAPADGGASDAKPDSAAPDGGLRYPSLGPVPPVPAFADDPITSAKVALGADIFFDVRLSGTGTTSCNSCHLAATHFQDNLVASLPDRTKPGQDPKLPRSTLSFQNLVLAPVSRWDGSLGAPEPGSTHTAATELLDVIVFPFAEPNMNLGSDVASAQLTLKHRFTVDAPGYVAAFQGAFGEDVSTLEPPAVWRLAGRALRAFVAQNAVSRDATFDEWNAGDDAAMSPSAVHGLEVFTTTGRCIACHNGPLFTDFSFHNLSTSPPRADGTRADEGRYYLTNVESDRGRFLTPTLRGVYDTGPYFHGSVDAAGGVVGSLAKVLAFLSSPAVTADPNHDPVFATPLTLSDQDVTDLLAFLKALRGAPPPLVSPPTAFP